MGRMNILASIAPPAIVAIPTVGVPLAIASPQTALTISIRTIYANGVQVATGDVTVSYTPVTADIGKTFTVVDLVPSTSRISGVCVAAPATKAVINSAPVITGTPTVGTAMSITPGSFTGGSPAPVITRVIYAGGTQVGTGSSYTPVSADVGKVFTVDDVATNAAGVVHNMSGNSAVCIAVAAVAPGAPSVVATKGPASATLVITPGTAGSSATTGYTVTLPNGASDADQGSTKLTRTITGLTPFAAQTFSVVANSAGGNSTAGVSNSVAADRVDTIAPTFVGGTITGNTVRLTYSEALTSGSIASSQFGLSLNGAAAIAPSALSQFGSLLVLTFPTAAAIGNTATISYTQGAAATAVRDVWNNLAANLSAQAINNNTAAATTNVYGSNRTVANDLLQTGASGITTQHFKFEAEDAFVGFRIGYIEHNTSGTMPNLEFLYGVSDTGAFNTVANEFYPTTNGVSKNVMATAEGEVAWRRGTWNSGSNVGTPVKSGVASYEGKVTWSDVMPISSLPRTDVVGGRPMLCVRVGQTLANAVYTQTAGSGYSGARGQPWHREIFSARGGTGADLVANVPSAVSAATSYTLAVFVEFVYANPIRSVIVTGDSRKSAAFNQYTTSWELIALRQAVGAGGKVGVVNCCGSGHGQIQFLKLVNDFLDSGGHATDLILPAFSQNGFTTAAAYASNMQPTLDRCATAGINIWMDTDYAVVGYTGNETQRQICLNAARSLLAQGKIKGLIDVDSLISDYGPQYPIIKAGTTTGGDGVHVGPTTQNTLMQPMLVNVWQ